MGEPDRLSQRELVMRIATLELLVADLLHLVRQLAPGAVETLAAEAARDVELQNARTMPADAEDQRYRLRQVMQGRARNLARHRFSSRLAARQHEPTD